MANERCEIRPYQLMCVICRREDAAMPPRLAELLRAVRAQPDLPLTLRCNVDSVFAYQNPGTAVDTPEGALYNVKRDLDILHRLGLAPGDTRPARQLFARLLHHVPTAQGLCGYGSAAPGWTGCPRAASGAYERGHAAGLAALIPSRADEEKAEVKTASAGDVLAATSLRLRPHHLLCMACFHAGQDDPAPIAEDNLAEAIAAIRRHPDIPVTLIPGCCMICPPCSQYEPAVGRCIAASGMGLRDEKKDLDLLQRLGLAYGDTLPARELYRRVFTEIASPREICGYGDGVARGWEWSVCGGSEDDAGYRRAREKNMGMKI